jgi:hypothetical protein
MFKTKNGGGVARRRHAGVGRLDAGVYADWKWGITMAAVVDRVPVGYNNLIPI